MPDTDTKPDATLARLEELAVGWLVSLTCVQGEWSLIVTAKDRDTQHVYRSRDLRRLINHAWAGAPGGRV